MNAGAAHALAERLGGSVIDPGDKDGVIILVPGNDRVHIIYCRAMFGSVQLASDDPMQMPVEIGVFSQGVDALVSAFYAAVDGMAA